MRFAMPAFVRRFVERVGALVKATFGTDSPTIWAQYIPKHSDDDELVSATCIVYWPPYLNTGPFEVTMLVPSWTKPVWLGSVCPCTDGDGHTFEFRYRSGLVCARGNKSEISTAIRRRAEVEYQMSGKCYRQEG